MPSLKEIINLPSLRKMKIVAGREGLDRMVDWVHFIDLPDVLPWIYGGELLFITGIGLEQDETRLETLVRGIAAKNLAGLVINIGPYIKKTPDTIIHLADELNFPTFELPWEVKLVQVIHDISTYILKKRMEEKSVSDLLENVLFNPGSDFTELTRRATYYGYDLGKSYQIGIVRASNFETVLGDHYDDIALMKLKGKFEHQVNSSIELHYQKSLTMFRMDCVIFLIPVPAGKINRNLTLAQEVITDCQQKMPDLTFHVGLGESFSDLKDARNSYDQARLALKYGDFLHAQNHVNHYSDIGVYKLLLDQKSTVLKAYFEETFGSLLEYDKRHGSELMATMAVYLSLNCNAVQAAHKLFIHKNTLTYRINKIENLTRKDINHMPDRITLQMALIIGKLLDLL
jgi:sugar diacid utilization regulator